MASTPSLWRRLQLLQPTLLLPGMVSHAKPTTAPVIPPPATLQSMAFSFVVVPPPVPAAVDAFQAHVGTLLRHVPHPTFITCTSYSPYFLDDAAEQLAAALSDDDVNEAKLSTTQKALSYLHNCAPADVALVLTITATRVTTNAKAAAPVEADPTLLGASRTGVSAVLADFRSRTSTGAVPHRSCGVMLLRGDDGGYTRRRALSTTAPPPCVPNPYATFKDGAELLRFVSDLAHQMAWSTVCLCTGGYAQGHIMDRLWGTSEPPVRPSRPTDVDSSQQTLDSFRFLDDFDGIYAETEEQLRCAQPRHTLHGVASIEACKEVRGALLARLCAVRSLWSAPSCYTPEARAASARWLVREKVLLPPSSGDSTDAPAAGAQVVVTQMLTSVEEFLDYVEDVRKALEECGAVAALQRDDGGVAAPLQREPQDHHGDQEIQPTTTTEAPPYPSPPPSLVIVPGLLAPLRAAHFLRATMQMKVIPSVALREALHRYEAALRIAGDALDRADVHPRSAASVSPMPDAVSAFLEAKEAAEMRFLEAMVDTTVNIIRGLHAHGYAHVNFSAFQYGCGDAIGRVVAALAAA